MNLNASGANLRAATAKQAIGVLPAFGAQFTVDVRFATVEREGPLLGFSGRGGQGVSLI